MPQEFNNVDRFSRSRWSHNHDTQPKIELSVSLQSKLDTVERTLRRLDSRFVYSSWPIFSCLNYQVTRNQSQVYLVHTR